MWHSKTLHHGTEQGLNGKTTLRFLTDVAHVLQDSWLHALFQGHAKAGTQISRVSICLEVRPKKIPEACNIKQSNIKQMDDKEPTDFALEHQWKRQRDWRKGTIWHFHLCEIFHLICISCMFVFLVIGVRCIHFYFLFEIDRILILVTSAVGFIIFMDFNSVYLNIQYHIKCCD